MLAANLVVVVCLTYVAVLFAVAFAGDRRAKREPQGLLSSPVVYTLSISIYCTSWTFFGAVGSAARSGLEFATIYIGPTVVFVGWWIFLRKLVAAGRAQRTTSIADFLSSRFGKSPLLGALVTLVAVVAATPYIALQLKALTASFQVISFPEGAATAARIRLEPDYAIAFWVAAGLCLFSMIFGVRNLDANERHHGVIAAIAVEAVVKLAALLAVGLWAVFGVTGTPAAAFADAPVSLSHPDQFGLRWVTLCFLAAAAVICLPRQFQVTVVENTHEGQLKTASWLFPLYLFLISLFVVPIALVGNAALPTGTDPDLYVLALPLSMDQEALGLFAFLGGFSSATSMVIVASIALSTMVSNHLIMPVVMRFWALPGAPRTQRFILNTRRLSVIAIVFSGFAYFWASGTSDALAAIGLIAFCGVAQFLPALVGGLFWRRASAAGALAGIAAGFALWAFCLFLPSFGGAAFFPRSIIEQGLFGLAWLRPHALFGIAVEDTLVHAVFWSMSVNVALFVAFSLLFKPTPLARFQSTLFVDVFRFTRENELRILRRSARSSDLNQIAHRILGPAEALQIFGTVSARDRGALAGDDLISQVERRVAARLGAASARLLVSKVVNNETISIEELKRIATETERIKAYSAELERKSRELEVTAQELEEANRRLREADGQKDDFLSQVSHEVRTPMAAIRSFSDILLAEPTLDEPQRERFLKIIQEESIRLTRLLDGLLDMSRSAEARHGNASCDPGKALERALASCEAFARSAGATVRAPQTPAKLTVFGDGDQLAQVFINLISNAIKHNRNPNPVVEVSAAREGPFFAVRIADNGTGIPDGEKSRLFEKFARGSTAIGRGAGLGLAISRQIATAVGGDLFVRKAHLGGAEFIARFRIASDESGPTLA